MPWGKYPQTPGGICLDLIPPSTFLAPPHTQGASPGASQVRWFTDTLLISAHHGHTVGGRVPCDRCGDQGSEK